VETQQYRTIISTLVCLCVSVFSRPFSGQYYLKILVWKSSRKDRNM